MTIAIREFKTPMPQRIARLLRDERGFPVPWFVAWIDGKPEFRVADKMEIALKERRCWVCGDPLGRNFCFVAGPMCGVNQISSEPPSHYECGRWSAENCPFLVNPQMVRREDETYNNERFREEGGGCPIARNPGVAMLWIARSFEVLVDPRKQKRVIVMGEPERVEWYREGRPASRAEVVEAIDSGMPLLEAGNPDINDIRKKRARLERWLPAE